MQGADWSEFQVQGQKLTLFEFSEPETQFSQKFRWIFHSKLVTLNWFEAAFAKLTFRLQFDLFLTVSV